jgi:hypothetical protein
MERDRGQRPPCPAGRVDRPDEIDLARAGCRPIAQPVVELIPKGTWRRMLTSSASTARIFLVIFCPLTRSLVISLFIIAFEYNCHEYSIVTARFCNSSLIVIVRIVVLLSTDAKERSSTRRRGHRVVPRMDTTKPVWMTRSPGLPRGSRRHRSIRPASVGTGGGQLLGQRLLRRSIPSNRENRRTSFGPAEGIKPHRDLRLIATACPHPCGWVDAFTPARRPSRPRSSRLAGR